MSTQQLKIGDRITFVVITRNGRKRATRKVNGFWLGGQPTVRFDGCSEFIVRPDEIKAVA